MKYHGKMGGRARQGVAALEFVSISYKWNSSGCSEWVPRWRVVADMRLMNRCYLMGSIFTRRIHQCKAIWGGGDQQSKAMEEQRGQNVKTRE